MLATAIIEQLFTQALQDPDLDRQMAVIRDLPAEQWPPVVVKAGKTRGLFFSTEDVEVWLQQSLRYPPLTELTDDELELVSGGAGVVSGGVPICAVGTQCRYCCSPGKACTTCTCPRPGVPC